jgi:hypothetical protein
MRPPRGNSTAPSVRSTGPSACCPPSAIASSCQCLAAIAREAQPSSGRGRRPRDTRPTRSGRCPTSGATRTRGRTEAVAPQAALMPSVPLNRIAACSDVMSPLTSTLGRRWSIKKGQNIDSLMVQIHAA